MNNIVPALSDRGATGPPDDRGHEIARPAAVVRRRRLHPASDSCPRMSHSSPAGCTSVVACYVWPSARQALTALADPTRAEAKSSGAHRVGKGGPGRFGVT